MRLRSRCGVRGVVPQGGEVGCEGRDSRLVVVVEAGSVSADRRSYSSCACGQASQGVVPVGFEVVGHEAVVGVNGEVAAAGLLGVMAGSFDVLAAQGVGLGGAGSSSAWTASATSSARGVTVARRSWPMAMSTWRRAEPGDTAGVRSRWRRACRRYSGIRRWPRRR